MSDPGVRVEVPGAEPRRRRFGWRRHSIRLEVTRTGRHARLISSRGAVPVGPCMLSFLVPRDGPEELRLYATVPSEAAPILVHEMPLPPSGGRVRRLVSLPRDAVALFIRAADPLPDLRRFRVREVGTVPLILSLGPKWIWRQIKEPRRVGEKIGNLLRVLRREGMRPALAGLIESQVARQGLLPARNDPAWTGRWAYVGAWAEEEYPPAPTSKESFTRARRRALRAFLASDARIRLPEAGSAAVSIVLVTYNRAELTLACLEAIAEHAPDDIEVIVVDNASTDQTSDLLGRADGALVLRNETNVGFVRACNRGVAEASGTEVLLLNNDALLMPGAVQAAVRTLRENPEVGVVGGRILTLDGKVQEAGSIVWRHGLCTGYGRGGDPAAPEYRFRRDVDYVSGAFLLTRRGLWNTLRGFDEAYAPAYYEDADYCLRVSQASYRVVYEPDAVVVHYEHGSSGYEHASAEILRNHETFVGRHGPWLRDRVAPGRGKDLAARHADHHCRRILVVDDLIPAATMGSGFPRTAEMLRGLLTLGFDVTFYPKQPFSGSWRRVRAVIPAEIEVMLGWGEGRLERFLTERRGHYDVILVSRAHNMALVSSALERNRRVLGKAMLVYDAEALGAARAIHEARANGRPLRPADERRLLKREVGEAARAHRVTSVSAPDMEAFRAAGIRDVRLLSHGVDPSPTPRSFSDRRNLLFVGRLSEDGSPNVDALLWFVDRVLPILRRDLEEEPPEVVVAGRVGAMALGARRWPGVRLLGAVEDLRPLYDQARLFVAPHRFAAGIPLKIVEAAAHGVPVVASDLLREQLGWKDDDGLLSVPVGDAERFARQCADLYRDEERWGRLRTTALERVASEYSRERFIQSLKAALHPASERHG